MLKASYKLAATKRYTNQIILKNIFRHISTNNSKQASIDHRTESDTMGQVKVQSNKFWGAQTQRSLKNFNVGLIHGETFPVEFIKALAVLKLAICKVNHKSGKLDKNLADPMTQALQLVIKGFYNDQFPLSVWQTGSATQTNMNMNEVVSNLSNFLQSNRDIKVLGKKAPVHPNDHVNLGQSSNDTIPTAMNIATVSETRQKLLPSLRNLLSSFVRLHENPEFKETVKIGRTHMQDATPLSFSQEFSAYVEQLELSILRIEQSLEQVLRLAQGGTAVGTGLNSYMSFDKEVCFELKEITGIEFKPANNKFEALATNDSLVYFMGALNTLACSLFKIGNDLRLLACGPRCGFFEISLPENEPGSSIMPGKVNPTQIEMLTMVCAQVMGNHTAVTIGGMNGHLQLNVYKPLIISNVLRSINLLSEAMDSFRTKLVDGIKLNKERVSELLNKSLMLVTALNPHIGYDKAAKIAKHAYNNKKTLKESALELNLLSNEDFDKMVDPLKMVGPSK